MTDREIIKQIEKELNIKLRRLSKIETVEKCYTLNQDGQVTGLGLFACDILNLNRIISPLKDLKHLDRLNLNRNQISNIAPLKEITNLTKLILKSNRLNDIPPLKELTNLKELDLSYNHLNYIPSFKELTNLKELDLSYNQIIDISPLKELKNLTGLFLHNNQISDISPLKELKNLTGLFLHNNQINDISPLKELNNLCTLWLSENKLQVLKPLEGLINLRVIGLGKNQIYDIFSLKYLKNLTGVDLHENQLNNILPLKELENLTRLNLANNNINDISALKNLRDLNRLDLIENPIYELPPWITDFDMKIKWDKYPNQDGYITFFNNPLKTPPPEIIQQGKEAVKNYYKQLKEQEEDYLFEAKMLIIGEPGAGKTSLACKMKNPDCTLPKDEETTKGIDVKQFYFPLQKGNFSAFKHPEKLDSLNFCLNLWDFGGQEIYKATHRFFLSKRSLYALVADSRNEDTDFNYWLHIVEMFGGDSPLLIVLNEKHQRKRHIDIAAMRNRFTNITEVLDVDFAETDKTRFNKLDRAIKYYVSQLPHIGSPVPAKWTIVRYAIENDKRNTISLQDYLNICQDNGITKSQDALVLSQYFHDIGVFLHFQDDDLLNKTIFLNPTWATNAVYKILDHPLLNQKNGRFNKGDAKVIWSEDEFEFLRDELLRLMQKFFLTYEIENSGEYIVPERLPAVQPKYDMNEKGNLFLRYEYELFMPKGILSQFTVEMHRYIGNHNNVWRRGVVLERENTTAEIIETYDARSIKIRISGKNKRDFMTIITETLDKINAQYEKMKVEKLIPCNCNQCKRDGKPHFYKFNDLKRRLEKGRLEIECENSYTMVNIRSLIDEVINEKLSNKDLRNKVFEQIACNQEISKRNKIFVSYSHKDQEWLTKVQTHLKVLNNIGIIVNSWDDTQIKPGMKWREEISKTLTVAKVAVLLISTDFLASDFICTDELPPLLKAAENDGATILPVILKPCLYARHPKLAEFQAVNDPAKPLSKLTEDEQDEVLVALAERIAELVGNDGKKQPLSCSPRRGESNHHPS